MERLWPDADAAESRTAARVRAKPGWRYRDLVTGDDAVSYDWLKTNCASAERSVPERRRGWERSCTRQSQLLNSSEEGCHLLAVEPKLEPLDEAQCETGTWQPALRRAEHLGGANASGVRTTMQQTYLPLPGAGRWIQKALPSSVVLALSMSLAHLTTAAGVPAFSQLPPSQAALSTGSEKPPARWMRIGRLYAN
jgi:hypothetical protein